MLKKALIKLLSPLRFAIRYEIKKNNYLNAFDIGLALQQRANESTVEYVIKNMSDVESVDSSKKIIDKALSLSDFNNGKLVLEFGVFSGSSINYIAKKVDCVVYGFDSFEGLPENWRDGFSKGHFDVEKLPSVKNNVTLIKGWFDITLPEFIKKHDANVAFIHVDCDLYSSTKTIFKFLENQISSGTVIVFDEYFNYPGWEEGEAKAFKEFILKTGLRYEYIGYNRLHEQVAIRII